MNMYEEITNRFIEELEKGTVPWQRPWIGVKEGAFSRATGKPCSLLNQLLLKKTGEYATKKQWVKLGGKLKEDADEEFIVHWNFKVKKVVNEDDKETEVTHKAYLKKWAVYHISQIEGVEPLPIEGLKDVEVIGNAEMVKEKYKIRESINIEETLSNRAFYRPADDLIVVPCINQYSDASEFYSTLFHEMIHSTGVKHRLNREDLIKTAEFGTESYSREELVAEIGSAMLCNNVGIDTEKAFRNSVAYVDGWLKALKENKNLIVTAASRAEKATKYILTGEKSGR